MSLRETPIFLDQMKRGAWYNENDKFAAQWLRNLIKAGLIPDGDVDERSILDVGATDIAGYAQCHFFAGIGGWPLAVRLAGIPDDRRFWTGSCPCQPFSLAGNRKGFADARDLWPVWFDLIRQCRPAEIFGEQVASATVWLDRVCADMEGEGYAVGAAILPACSVDAPHKRDRWWFVADAQGIGRGAGCGEDRSFEDRLSAAGGSATDRGLALGEPCGARLSASEREALCAEGRRQEGGAVAEPSRAGVDLVDASGERRREGRSEHEFRRGRGAVAGAGGTGVGLADTYQSVPGEGWEQRSREFGGIGGDPEARDGGRDGDGYIAVCGLRDGRTDEPERGAEGRAASWWAGAEYVTGADGKSRRVKPGIRLLAAGLSGRVAVSRTGEQTEAAIQDEIRRINRIGALRGLGNAIVPQVAAEFMRAYYECRP